MHPRYQQAFATLPTLLQSALQPILAADDFAGFITASQAGELKKHCGLPTANWPLPCCRWQQPAR